MKKILFSLSVFLASCLITGSAIPSFVKLMLCWEHTPTPYTTFIDQSNFCFNVYATTNIGTPVTNYPITMTITNWSLGPIDTNGMQWMTSSIYTFPTGQWFAFNTASNSSGESGPSNVAFISPIAQQPANLGIKVSR